MKKFIPIFALVLILSTVACVSEKPREEVTIKMGYLGGLAQPEVYAMYNGYYKEEGLNVSWVTFRGGSSVVKAIMAGELDGGVIGSTPAIIRAVSKDVPIKIVAVGELGTVEKPGDYLVVKKDSGIGSMEDLKGKTIAVHRLGTTLDLTLRIGLKESGLDPASDVTITQVSVPNQPQALLEDEVDAAFIFPMAYPQLEDDVDVILTPGDVFPQGAPFGMVMFTEEFIAEHPDEVEKFVKAYLDGIQWAVDNPDKAAELAAEDIGASVEDTVKMPWPAFNPSGKISDDSFELMIDAIEEYDPESMGRTVTVGELVDYQFLPSEV